MKPAVLFTLVAALLAACGPPYYVNVEYEPMVAPSPPPEDLAETQPPAPWADAVWAPGYWYWTGVRYVWVGGYWTRPPEIGFVWVHPGWVFIDGIFRFMAGRWAHPHRVPHYPYYHPHRGGPGPRHR